MTDLKQAVATQLANIEQRTGKSLSELTQIINNSGLSKHGELVTMLKTSLGMGHGDANTLVHSVRQTDGQSAAEGLSDVEVLDGLYIGAKAVLRPIHDALLLEIQKLGEFEAAPKKTYVSYRRNKQFVMIGPATNSQLEVGLNIKQLPEDPRLKALPAGQMCNFKVRLSDVSEVDAQLLGWIKAAFLAAG
ncbi:DUF4287 domain-containing protein [Rheinheimera riviphila]|uniref:DUF4287 domain-containing protein n=1 Tax=Rheinheimera riviphila TaxID=1834037 RepID=A0A437QFC2_9GAMM|nr:DUF4287 domain-containing protein [Rheinheimera riviphila]RVU33145.1 DUF4287 domain-containing protein [Rheinheimera riviphila]